MKPLTFITDTLACIETPTESHDFEVDINPLTSEQWLVYNDGHKDVQYPLPSGNWQYIGYATRDDMVLNAYGYCITHTNCKHGTL